MFKMVEDKNREVNENSALVIDWEEFFHAGLQFFLPTILRR